MTLFDLIQNWGTVVSMGGLVAFNFVAMKLGLRSLEKDFIRYKTDAEKVVDRIDLRVHENEKAYNSTLVILSGQTKDIEYIRKTLDHIEKKLP